MRIWLRAGIGIVTAGLVGASVALGFSGGGPGGSPPLGRHTGPEPAPAIQLVAYPSCAQMLDDLRRQTAQHVQAWGLAPDIQLDTMSPTMGTAQGTRMSAPGAAVPAAPAAPEHSTTNVHEAGVDEPDLVKTDGRRVVTAARGVLRVIDAATHQVTGRVRLTSEGRMWTPANLLLAGDRALVILPQSTVAYAQGPSVVRPLQPATRFVLVDLSGTPEIAGTMTVSGQYVDARMVGSTVRLVARSQPQIHFPPPPGNPGNGGQKQLIERNRDVVRRAPIGAWLPRYRITDGHGATSTRTVDCGQVSHPREYTGTSMLTVYSVDMTRGLGGIPPVSIAADGDIVYGTHTSLYVASNPNWGYVVPLGMAPRIQTAPPILPRPRPQRTEIHRFDITTAGAPRYVGSGSVPGRLLNQYSLSEYDGYLRVATTTGQAVESGRSTSASAVYELDADTMARVGSVGGLGKGQRIYSVRFIGPVGYVVTFRQLDPLYTLDLRDPADPRVAGELELTGYSAYLSPAADGMLLGVGQEADAHGRPLGLQVSLFDVRDPAHPQRVARQVLPETGSAAEYDPHAFLYWAPTGTAVLPVNSSAGDAYTASALVLKVARSGIATQGRITPPADSNGYHMGVSRAMVIGESLWTLSDQGVQVSNARTLAREAWIPLA